MEQRGSGPSRSCLRKVLILMLAGTELGVSRWDLGWEQRRCRRDSQDSGLVRGWWWWGCGSQRARIPGGGSRAQVWMPRGSSQCWGAGGLRGRLGVSERLGEELRAGEDEGARWPEHWLWGLVSQYPVVPHPGCPYFSSRFGAEPGEGPWGLQLPAWVLPPLPPLPEL